MLSAIFTFIISAAMAQPFHHHSLRGEALRESVPLSSSQLTLLDPARKLFLSPAPAPCSGTDISFPYKYRKDIGTLGDATDVYKVDCSKEINYRGSWHADDMTLEECMKCCSGDVTCLNTRKNAPYWYDCVGFSMPESIRRTGKQGTCRWFTTTDKVRKDTGRDDTLFLKRKVSPPPFLHFNAADPRSFTLTYQKHSCCMDDNGEMRIQGFKPTIQPTGVPIEKCFIYVLGTTEDILDTQYPYVMLDDMAQNGFLSAVVEYPYWDLLSYLRLRDTCDNCSASVANGMWPSNDAKFAKPITKLEFKAFNIFSEKYDGSAINAIKNRFGASCTKLVVSGFSQGSHIAVLARNFNNNVQGAFLLASGCQATFGVSTDNCATINKARTLIPRSRVRGVQAQNDGTLGCETMSGGRTSMYQTKLVTGANCDAPNSLLDQAGPNEQYPAKGCKCGINDECDAGFRRSNTLCNVDGCSNQCYCENFRNQCFTNDGATDLGADSDAGGYYIIKDQRLAFRADKNDEGTGVHGWFKNGDLDGSPIWDEAWMTNEGFSIPKHLKWLRKMADMRRLGAADIGHEVEAEV